MTQAPVALPFSPFRFAARLQAAIAVIFGPRSRVAAVLATAAVLAPFAGAAPAAGRAIFELVRGSEASLLTAENPSPEKSSFLPVLKPLPDPIPLKIQFPFNNN